MAFWDFRWMIMPVFIRALFVVAVLACAVVGMTMIVKGVYSTDPVMPVLNGLGVLILGPLAYRLIAEWLIVFFRIHEALESIDRKLGER